ncbi:hypothetical protein M0811_06262 [Anaeramoeba ignava]|uniref:Uncharacterized protein n=1 Tax=Anaeramoeba ignava TaxID=1746090 RepID=A0A9Q0LPI1_ANAIG|nr:hypothetical protein M0811_06262 [Anaeramoeba ignava]
MNYQSNKNTWIIRRYWINKTTNYWNILERKFSEKFEIIFFIAEITNFTITMQKKKKIGGDHGFRFLGTTLCLIFLIIFMNQIEIAYYILSKKTKNRKFLSHHITLEGTSLSKKLEIFSMPFRVIWILY